jgi:hypothetical protein
MAMGVDSASNRNEYQEYFLGGKAAGSAKWGISLRFPYLNPVYISSSTPYVLHAPLISFFLI